MEKMAKPFHYLMMEKQNVLGLYIRCSDGSYYTGHTDNLERRMGQYQAGECAGYIATRLPIELIWSQETATREEALTAERQIKGWSRKKKEAMIRCDWAEAGRLAKSKSVHPSTSPGRTDLLFRDAD
ncbi:MAG: GIY-YIG nuclease family protein [Methylococcales bacterium]